MSDDKPSTNTDEPTAAAAITGYVATAIEQGESAEAIRIQLWADMATARQQTVATKGTESKHGRLITARGKPQGEND